MKKQRGGQSKHWAERARLWAWYFKVRNATEWTDYKLDLEFAWKPEARQLRSTGDRPRTFEWIRKRARKPSRSEQWRSMEELVAAVEEHPQFTGTKRLYEAEIWDMFQEGPVKPEYVEARIARILEANGLVRVQMESEKGLRPLVPKYKMASVVDRCLRLSLSQIDRFSSLALAWSLYLLTEPAEKWELRSMIEIIVDSRLDNFFGSLLPRFEHMEFYSNAIDTLLNARLDLSSLKGMGYGYLENDMRVVLPKSLQGKVSEEHLFMAF